MHIDNHQVRKCCTDFTRHQHAVQFVSLSLPNRDLCDRVDIDHDSMNLQDTDPPAGKTGDARG
jgi:hypothetical protein